MRTLVLEYFIDSISCMTDMELQEARDYIDRMLQLELEE